VRRDLRKFFVELLKLTEMSANSRFCYLHEVIWNPIDRRWISITSVRTSIKSTDYLHFLISQNNPRSTLRAREKNWEFNLPTQQILFCFQKVPTERREKFSATAFLRAICAPSPCHAPWWAFEWRMMSIFRGIDNFRAPFLTFFYRLCSTMGLRVN
jgi:hypothetical protein